MTSKQNKLGTPTKPAPVELHDEALDRVGGGAELASQSGSETARLDDKSSTWVRVLQPHTSGS